MKRLIINFSIFFSLFYFVNSLYPLFATVENWNAAIEESPGSTNVLCSLVPGMVINVEKPEGIYSKASYKNFKGWIYIKNIVIFNNQFSNTKNKAILSKKIFQEKGKGKIG